MVLRNRQGQESRRQLRFKVLEVEGDGNRSIFVFDEPLRNIVELQIQAASPPRSREDGVVQTFPGGTADRRG